MEIQPWIVQVLASIIGGGLAGGILTIAYNWWTAKQRAIAQEKATIAALVGELRRNQSLCDTNRLGNPPKSFVPFSCTVAEKVAFSERHNYPRLESFQRDLEDYTLALLQVNQLIASYELLLRTRPENHETVRKIDEQIVNTCLGHQTSEFIGNLKLPQKIAQLKIELEKLNEKTR